MLSRQMLMRSQQCCADLYSLCGIESRVVDVAKKKILRAENDKAVSFCDTCSYIKCRARATHAYGCNEAYRWSGYYLYYCPLGLTFLAGCLCGVQGELVGGISVGPFISGNREDTLEQIAMRTKAVHAEELSVLDSAHCNALGRHLELLCCGLSEDTGRYPMVATSPAQSFQTACGREKYSSSRQWAEDERQLYQFICEQDRVSAQELLDCMLTNIYVGNSEDLEDIRRCSVELAVLIGRVSAHTGADAQEVFGNGDYLSVIQRFYTTDQLHRWMAVVVRRFIDYTFEFRQVKHANVVFAVKKYIRQHYDQKLSLDDIAAQTFLSAGHLSTVFKEETGETVVSFLNRIRVEESKKMLLNGHDTLVEIAHACGFEDQSYFARVFKKVAGVSPGRFRDARGRI